MRKLRHRDIEKSSPGCGFAPKLSGSKVCVLNYYAKHPLRTSGLSNMELLGWEDLGKELSESHSHLIDKCQIPSAYWVSLGYAFSTLVCYSLLENVYYQPCLISLSSSCYFPEYLTHPDKNPVELIILGGFSLL